MSVEDEYARGVDSYWAGDIPRGWEAADWGYHAVIAKAARSPYIMGWYQASLADNGMI